LLLPLSAIEETIERGITSKLEHGVDTVRASWQDLRSTPACHVFQAEEVMRPVIRSVHDPEVIALSKLRQPLAKSVLRCDKGLRLIVGGTYGVTRTHENGKPRFHGGIDLSAEVGTDCYAIAESTVEWANREIKGLGITVLLRFTIEQQTLWALYAHLQKALVTEGKVEKGSIVGKTGVSGRPENSLYPHLHFEIWTSLKAADKHLKQKHSLDPITILGPLPLQPLANEVIEAYTERA
jgi:murein DD-endopeptidase MepM/ murein hydrolase activator NlpD